MYFNDKVIESSRDQEIEGMKENICHSANAAKGIERVRDQKIYSFTGSLGHSAT